MVYQTDEPVHQAGDTVTVWFDMDHVYVGRVERATSERLTVKFFGYEARANVSPSLVMAD